MEKVRELQKIKHFCLIDYAKDFNCVDHMNCGKFLKRWDYQTTLPTSCETCMQVKKQQLESDMEQWAVSKLGKEYVKVIYCQPAYLAYMQCTSWEMPYWMNYKLGSRLLGEISTTSDMQMAESEEELKSLSMRVKEESEKADLKFNIKKKKN